MSTEDIERAIELISEEQVQFAKRVNPKVAALVESQMRLAEGQARTHHATSSTNGKIGKLNSLLDRYFEEGGNGQLKP